MASYMGVKINKVSLYADSEREAPKISGPLRISIYLSENLISKNPWLNVVF